MSGVLLVSGLTFLVGFVRFFLAAEFAALFHVENLQVMGIIELRTFYGGLVMALAVFMLTIQDNFIVLQLCQSCFLMLAVSRFLALSLVFHSIAENPSSYLAHFFILFLVEIPLFLGTSVVLQRLPVPIAKLTTTTARWIQQIKLLAMTFMLGTALFFLIFPREAGEFYFLRSNAQAVQSGTVEFQTTFGGLRLGILVFLVRCRSQASCLWFLSVLVALLFASRVMAVALYYLSFQDMGQHPLCHFKIMFSEMLLSFAALFAYVQEHNAALEGRRDKLE